MKSYKSVGIVIIVFIGLSLYYDMPYWLTQRPTSVHVWRQSDCASYALNYYQNERTFFSPQVHHRHAIDGSTCSEFPVIYYMASGLYKIFGFHDYYIRWIGYLMFFAALVCLTLTARFFIVNWILQAFPAVLLMLSCVLVYYSGNFLPDAPALGMAVIGFYFFVRHYFDGKDRFVWLAVTFFSLAGLLKISSSIFFVVMIAYMLYNTFILKSSKYNKAHGFAAFSGLIVLFSWLLFVRFYNEMGQYFGNLQGTMGIWTIDKNNILYIIQRTFQEWMPALVSMKIWIFLIPVILYIAYYWKQTHELLRFFLLLTTGACLVYLFSFFAVFNVHDYYFINMISLPVIISLAFFQVVEKSLKPTFLRVFIGLSLLLFAMCAEDAKAQFEFRKTDPGWNSIPPKGFYSIEPYLRKLGINRNELVYSPSDPTTNVTLYLMNNPGWTRLFGVDVKQAIERGAKFMVIEKSLFDTDEFAPYKNNVIGEHEGLLVITF